MYERGRSSLVVLTVITLSALGVAFGSSAKAKVEIAGFDQLQKKVLQLNKEMADLRSKWTQTQKAKADLEKQLKITRNKMNQNARYAKELKRELNLEQARNKSLQHQLSSKPAQ